ncbi:hypothetical protein TCSYLVIO_002833 [Trypanosoma cruzi]|nr:hypothetical protein TCSYLVIO_002833 [Trypanosoma cruzi]
MAAQRREDISVAFRNSSYPTPYGDNTIPGDHPGCRHKRLGRQYAPLPINKSSLTTDLHVPGCGLGRHGPVLPADINNHIQQTLLIRDTHNSNYVLDSERGGKRHFAEQRGSEQPWSPSLRRLVPIMSGDVPLLPQRRAIGVYNPTMPGPELKKSLEQREREVARQQVGKAHVNRPPDHHPLDLFSFYVTTDSARLPSQDDTPAAAAIPPMDVSPAPASQDLEGGENVMLRLLPQMSLCSSPVWRLHHHLLTRVGCVVRTWAHAVHLLKLQIGGKDLQLVKCVDRQRQPRLGWKISALCSFYPSYEYLKWGHRYSHTHTHTRKVASYY